MQIYKKEKSGNKRIITLFGIKFSYTAGRSYKFEEVVSSGLNTEKRNEKIIVSLTSFSARILYVYKTVTSLLQQTVKPDVVVLWLAEEEFPNKEKDLPENLLNLKQYGLTIKWCNNIRSYKKLIPTLKEFPDDIIITTDDDIYYDKKMIELLYNSYLKNPEYIHCHRCTKIFYKNNKIKAKPKHFYTYPSFANKLVGVGGVLYPPKCLYKDITDESLFMSLAPTNDDIWFWLMAVMNDTKIKIVKKHISEPAEVNETLEGPCLTKINDHGENLFYKDLRNVLNHYQGLEDKIKVH